MISGTERQKTINIIEKITIDNFDYNDIDLLFVRLRAYSENSSIFKEISNFIPHNEIRNQGLINDSMNALNDRLTLLFDKNKTNNMFDISIPFPKYILEMVKLQLKKIDKNFLRSEFGFTKTMLENRFNKDFRIDKNGFVNVKNTSQNVLDVFIYCVNTVGTIPDMHQDNIILDIVRILNKNQFIFDDSKIICNGDKIMLCILLLLNRTKYELRDKKIVYCHIYYNSEDADVIKKLGLYAEVFSPEYRDISFGYPIIATNLCLDDWCDKSIITQLNEKKANRGLNQSLIINDKFKLMPLGNDNTVQDIFFDEIDHMNSVRFVLKNVSPKSSKNPRIRAIINQIISK
jgi:hypothetical protein